MSTPYPYVPAMYRFKRRTYEILFAVRDADRAATLFSAFILSLIGLNVLAGILETDSGIRAAVNDFLGFADSERGASRGSIGFFFWFELVSIVIFTVEYGLRLWSCTADENYTQRLRGRWRMARRPMLIIDLIAIVPFYLQALMPGLDLRFVRALRLFRLFRLFRSSMLSRSVDLVTRVLKARRDELLISFVIVIVAVIFSASVMYLVEHQTNDQFSSVPQAMWWAVITITTIGYGDMTPMTPLGQFIGAFIAFLGVCIFALPVGIIGAGFIEEIDEQKKRAAAQESAQAAALAESGEASTEEAAEVESWLERGRARVRACAAWTEVTVTSQQQHAVALAAVLNDGQSRAALLETYGDSFTASALMESEMAAAFLAWADGAVGMTRSDWARHFASTQHPEQDAADLLAGALATVIDSATSASERRRMRLMLLTLIGSAAGSDERE